MGQGFIRVLHPGGSANERLDGTRINIDATVPDTGDVLAFQVNAVDDCIYGLLIFAPVFHQFHFEVDGTGLTPAQIVAAFKVLYDANPIANLTFNDNLDGTGNLTSDIADAYDIGVQFWGRHKTNPVERNVTINDPAFFLIFGSGTFPLARLVGSAPWTIPNAALYVLKINQALTQAVTTRSGTSADQIAGYFAGGDIPNVMGTLQGLCLAPVQLYQVSAGSTTFNVELISDSRDYALTVVATPVAEMVKTKLVEYADGSGAYHILGKSDPNRTYLKMRSDSGPAAKYNFGAAASADHGDTIAAASYVEFMRPAGYPSTPLWSGAINIFVATASEFAIGVAGSD